MSFDPLTENEPAAAVSSAITASRLKRQLVDQAIDAARQADWIAAAEINEKILEMGPDSAAENRTAKAYWEQGELGQAREHYQSALALDPTNRIAERNIHRLRMLMVDAGSKTVPAQAGSKAPVSIFVEETGKTGFAHLVDLADPIDLAQVEPRRLRRAESVRSARRGQVQRRQDRRRRAAGGGPPAAPDGRRQQVRGRRHQPR